VPGDHRDDVQHETLYDEKGDGGHPKGKPIYRLSSQEEDIEAEPDRQIENYLHHRRGNGRQGSREEMIAAKSAPRGTTLKNPEKTRDECEIDGDQPAQYRAPEAEILSWRQPAMKPKN
jgi:hypothetical protein